MDVIFPIAGFGTRFANSGITTLKPFIKHNGITLLEYAIKSLNIKGTYHVIARKLPDEYKTELQLIFERNGIEGRLYELEQPTRGAAETCLSIKDSLDPNSPLIITNCDQYTPWDNTEFIKLTERDDVDAIVTTYDHGDIVLNEKSPYSFIKLGEDGFAVEFSEKFAISEWALNGIHYWKKTSSFIESAEELMITETGQEKFISLSFNFLIKKGYKILNYHMAHREFFALGTPDELSKNKENL
jgi:NDP-sugar pyrophosphorylase family protein